MGNRLDKKMKLEVNWQHTKELTPAFRRLMRILLEPSPQLNNKKGGKR